MGSILGVDTLLGAELRGEMCPDSHPSEKYGPDPVRVPQRAAASRARCRSASRPSGKVACHELCSSRHVTAEGLSCKRWITWRQTTRMDGVKQHAGQEECRRLPE
jgi:hypothetical protein